MRFRNRIYYRLKPLIPRRFQVWLRARVAARQRVASAASWPILESAGQPPPGWTGWPAQKQFALVLRHDVETEAGQRKCLALMHLEEAAGFRSSFNFVPERYHVSAAVRATLVTHGFEVGVHGLCHDGRLYLSRAIFEQRTPKINAYLEQWQAVGFASPSSHHRLDWNHALRIEYDTSTFDTDPFEGEPDPIKSIFPQWISGGRPHTGYVELPFTLPQDFELFILLREQNTDIWQRKLAWVAAKGGMALLVSHPDYMSFPGESIGFQTYPVDYYLQFLNYVRCRHAGRYWPALPREVARFYRQAMTGPAPALRLNGAPICAPEDA